MLKEITDKQSRKHLFEQKPFLGMQHKCGRVTLQSYKADSNDARLWMVRLGCQSCHQVFKLYGYMWDWWLQSGKAFDEFRLVKSHGRYYADIFFAPPEDSRLKVSVIINNKKTEGYEND